MCAELKEFRAKSGNLCNVLLVDDDPLQLRTREAILRSAGFHVCIASTAKSALAILRSGISGFIGAVVTDHIMPGLRGDQFVRELRTLSPTIPVIVISGMAEAESEYEELNVHFRLKPCPPHELIVLVKALLDRAA